jgi:exonuclease III
LLLYLYSQKFSLQAKHITKQAGLTALERNGHTALLGTEFKDSLRYFYPDARGQFTYWSQRTFARPVNKGIRLDYFICSNDMYAERTGEVSTTAEENSTAAVVAKRRSVPVEDIPSPGVYDSYSLPEDTVGCSDHCPAVLVVKV